MTLNPIQFNYNKDSKRIKKKIVMLLKFQGVNLLSITII